MILLQTRLGFTPSAEGAGQLIQSRAGERELTFQVQVRMFYRSCQPNQRRRPSQGSAGMARAEAPRGLENEANRRADFAENLGG